MTYTNKDYTRAEIVEALYMIQDICEQQEGCENCPFADQNEVCLIQCMSPESWTIREEAVWRALG